MQTSLEILDLALGGVELIRPCSLSRISGKMLKIIKILATQFLFRKVSDLQPTT